MRILYSTLLYMKVFRISHKAWNKLMHTLMGNGAHPHGPGMSPSTLSPSTLLLHPPTPMLTHPLHPALLSSG